MIFIARGIKTCPFDFSYRYPDYYINRYYSSIISQKPPLSGPTRRRYLPRMTSIFALMAATLIPTSFDKSAFDIYGSSITKRRMEILFPVNLSPCRAAFSINFSINF